MNKNPSPLSFPAPPPLTPCLQAVESEIVDRIYRSTGFGVHPQFVFAEAHTGSDGFPHQCESASSAQFVFHTCSSSCGKKSISPINHPFRRSPLAYCKRVRYARWNTK